MQMRALFQGGVLALLAGRTVASSPRDTADFEPRKYPDPISYREQPGRAEAIKDAFRASWFGYYEHAFPNDTLCPRSNGSANDRNGWGVTAIDSLSTALLMEEFEIVDQILAYVPEIKWTRTSVPINVFETTIRYLGGLLSGYDLIKGPFRYRKIDEDATKQLLLQAYELGEMLKYAFYTPAGIPDNEFVFSTAPRRRNLFSSNSLATLGTLVLEWTRLSDALEAHMDERPGKPSKLERRGPHNHSSGKGKYCHFANLAWQANKWLIFAKKEDQPFPGLLGTHVDTQTGRFLDRTGGWGGGTDSYYEYLLKLHIYDPDRFSLHKDLWIKAADSTIQHLVSHPLSKPDSSFVHVAAYADGEPYYLSGHLACFVGGNFIQGGLALKTPKYVEAGLAMVDGCHEVYKSTATGIGPEVYEWRDSLRKYNDRQPPAGQQEFYERSGFWITEGRYLLRPEVIESYYYAYKLTGDAKYQDWAWEAFVAINATCRAESGFFGITNVNQKGGGGFFDIQESYWLAETLKYSYLIQTHVFPDVQKTWSGGGDWVFNTEGHPLRKPCTSGKDGGQVPCKGKQVCTFDAKNPWA